MSWLYHYSSYCSLAMLIPHRFLTSSRSLICSRHLNRTPNSIRFYRFLLLGGKSSLFHNSWWSFLFCVLGPDQGVCSPDSRPSSCRISSVWIPEGPFPSKCLATSYKQHANQRALHSATVLHRIPNIPSSESSTRTRSNHGSGAGEHVWGSSNCRRALVSLLIIYQG